MFPVIESEHKGIKVDPTDQQKDEWKWDLFYKILFPCVTTTMERISQKSVHHSPPAHTLEFNYGEQFKGLFLVSPPFIRYKW